MPPADAERVASGVGVYLVALLGLEVGWLKQPGAEPDRCVVGSSRIFDVEVEVHLLRSPIRPFGRNVVRGQLHTDIPLAGGTDDRMKAVVCKDVPAEDPGPESALGIQIGSIEHDDVTDHVHGPTVTGCSDSKHDECAVRGPAPRGQPNRFDVRNFNRLEPAMLRRTQRSGPRWGARPERWLRASEVPPVGVVVHPSSVNRFDRFLSEHPWRAPGEPWPIELYVDLVREKRGGISVWLPPSRILRATLVGDLDDEGRDAYEDLLARLPRHQVPMVRFTAPGGLEARYRDATVSGLPDDWQIPHPDNPPSGDGPGAATV